MALESATYIADLVPTNPVGATDTKSQGDDHIRMIKATMQATFPGADRPFPIPSAVSKSSDYTILATDQNKLVLVNALGAARTITLPTLAASLDGWSVEVMKDDGSTNVVTVAGTINGLTNYSIERRYIPVLFTWTGAEWVSTESIQSKRMRVVTKTATGALAPEDVRSFILVTPAAPVTLTLPDAIRGDWVYIKNMLATSGAVTIVPAGGLGNDIDNENNFILDEQYESVLLVSDGSDWFIASYFVGTFPRVPAEAPSNITNLKIDPHATTPNTKISITADEVELVDAATGFAIKHSSVSVTIDLTTSGANGLDTGARAADTPYYIWLISNGTTVAGILHATNANAPTMPGGYTYKKRIGWVRTNASSNFYRVVQRGDHAQYVLGTVPTVPVLIDSGVTGTYSTTAPTLANKSLTGLIPGTAKSVLLMATNSYKGNGPHGILVAPTTSWGGAANGPSGANGMIYPIWMGAGVSLSMSCEIALDTLDVAMAGDGTGSALAVLGWRDRIL